MLKRCLVLMLGLSLIISGAHAEFFSAYDELAKLSDADIPVRASISITLDKLNASEGGLAALKNLVEPLSLTLGIQKGRQSLRLSRDGASLLHLSGKAENADVLKFDTLKAFFLEGLPALYTALDTVAVGETSKRSLSIKNVGKTAQQTVYTLTAEAANLLLPSLSSLLGPYAGLLPSDSLKAYAKALAFDSDITVKRYMDKEGADIGVQITGKIVNAGQDRRSLTLYGGYSENKGAYLSLSCPATKGKNNDKAVFSYAVKTAAKQNTLTASLDATGSLNDSQYALALDISLKNKKSDSLEHLTGSVKIEETVRGVQNSLALTPDFEARDGRIAGHIKAIKKADRSTVFEATAAAVLEAGESADMSGAIDINDPKAVSYLTGALKAYQDGLTDEERRLLAHMLRTDAWMNGSTVPVQNNLYIGGAQLADWTVTEE